ncbi:MAG: NAD(P)H-binding protein [Ignavibacteriales bacterium]|nr:NAD(P)H-binding protein [Ignavibacteriales bacterium]
MKVLVIGASGATGKLVIQNALKRENKVKAIYRESSIIPNNFADNQYIEIVKGNITEFSMEQLNNLIMDCDAVICCLGHNLSFKGIFLPPYKLVFGTVINIFDIMRSRNLYKKFILMNTTGYTNSKIGEKNTFGEIFILSLLKIFLPPHRDNMLAADFLINKISKDSNMEWVAVRPDSLIDESYESEYEVLDQKKTSPIFNPGKTSRINVSHFMVDLLTNNDLWNKWKFKTPVIYNKV